MRPSSAALRMVRATTETYAELQRIALEMDRSVSWILNDLATKFIAERGKRKA